MLNFGNIFSFIDMLSIDILSFLGRIIQIRPNNFNLKKTCVIDNNLSTNTSYTNGYIK